MQYQQTHSVVVQEEVEIITQSGQTYLCITLTFNI